MSQQILAGIKREIARLIQDGDVANIQLKEIEKKKSLLTVFRR
jgi:hypothetical protein